MSYSRFGIFTYDLRDAAEEEEGSGLAGAQRRSEKRREWLQRNQTKPKTSFDAERTYIEAQEAFSLHLDTWARLDHQQRNLQDHNRATTSPFNADRAHVEDPDAFRLDQWAEMARASSEARTDRDADTTQTGGATSDDWSTDGDDEDNEDDERMSNSGGTGLFGDGVPVITADAEDTWPLGNMEVLSNGDEIIISDDERLSHSSEEGSEMTDLSFMMDGVDEGSEDIPPSQRRRDRSEEVDQLANAPLVMPRRRFTGHSNIQTVKDVNWIGGRDQWVISGSDSGDFFIWEAETEKLQGIWKGDNDVVNVMQPHPFLPVSYRHRNIDLLVSGS